MVVAFEGRAQLRLVRTGKRLASDVEVISGLEIGEKVVAMDPDRVREGQPLEVIP